MAVPTWNRVALVLLAVPNLLTGMWALVDPKSFFDDFPGWAPRLVAAFPPYNEHLATDAGAGLFATGVLAGVAAIWPRREVIVTAMLGYLAFTLPHTLWHVTNPSDFLTGSEDLVNDVTLVAAVILTVAVLASVLRSASPAEVPSEEASA